MCMWGYGEYGEYGNLSGDGGKTRKLNIIKDLYRGPINIVSVASVV